MKAELTERTANETLIYMYLIEKLGRIYEGRVFDKEWAFDWGNRETPECYCFAIAVEYRGDQEWPLQTSTKSSVAIAIATEDNIEFVQSKTNGLMSEYSPKPEIIVVIRADRPQVDTWTLVSGEYQHTAQDHGEIEIFALGGDFYFGFSDVYEDVDGIYEQVAA